MRHLTALISFIFLTASSVWAQAPAPSPSPGATPDAPPVADPVATGGIMDYWWVILLVIIVVLAIWYFSRSRNRV
jgi:hypothetical protein